MSFTRRALLGSASALAVTARTRRPPNVIILITDDQGFGDLSLHGNPHLATPHIDSIGRDGIRFSQFQVSPVCSPTRSSLMTGRYNYRTGVVDTYLGRSLMHPGEVTLPEYLARAGYRTGIFGKWHLGDNHPMRAMDQGFEESIVCNGGGIGQPSDPPANSYYDPVLQHNGRARRFTGYCTDIFFDQATRWIERVKKDRFFCYLSTNAPHDPLTIAAEKVEPFRAQGLDEPTARTYAMIANIDDNVGRLLAFLRRQKLERDTLLIFLTDNGPQRDRFNAGMRGRKGTVYQGGIRVPCFWKWPGGWTGGREVNRIAAHIDILPTLLELAALKAGGPPLDGRSLLPLLRDEPVEWADRTLFTQWHRGDEPELFRACAARNQRYKLVDGRELYDLLADPGETRDVAAERPEIARKLRAQTEAWFRDVSATRGYAPPRIHIGTPHENPVTLTRQDWRGPRASWDPTGLGHWELDIRAAGSYRVTLRMPALPAAGQAELRIGDFTARQPVAAGATEVLFVAPLPAGAARLESVLTVGGATFGAHYVDILRS
jgi:arylsulfatase A-like enzyme